MDKNNDNLLNYNEFINDINNSYINRKELGKLFFQAMDENNNNKINYNEFKMNNLSNNIQMQTIFLNRDFNKDGLIDLNEFLGILNYKIKESEEITKLTTISIKTNKTLYVSNDKFIDIYNSTNNIFQNKTTNPLITESDFHNVLNTSTTIIHAISKLTTKLQGELNNTITEEINATTSKATLNNSSTMQTIIQTARSSDSLKLQTISTTTPEPSTTLTNEGLLTQTSNSTPETSTLLINEEQTNTTKTQTSNSTTETSTFLINEEQINTTKTQTSNSTPETSTFLINEEQK
ncbi:hypothetical protein Mgra_00005345 [Meloidogyne graminicola]|uniref:EF-hand domain-containing protein n=1 Tax=Meloidogyne graminicola TaxID=189291 RepID=A0A8S9ZP75_9BILA|nr:hypothetical protein Mgra_00005345 [Meloidogyne graminicola]